MNILKRARSRNASFNPHWAGSHRPRRDGNGAPRHPPLGPGPELRLRGDRRRPPPSTGQQPQRPGPRSRRDRSRRRFDPGGAPDRRRYRRRRHDIGTGPCHAPPPRPGSGRSRRCRVVDLDRSRDDFRCLHRLDPDRGRGCPRRGRGRRLGCVANRRPAVRPGRAPRGRPCRVARAGRPEPPASPRSACRVGDGNPEPLYAHLRSWCAANT